MRQRGVRVWGGAWRVLWPAQAEACCRRPPPPSPPPFEGWRRARSWAAAACTAATRPAAWARSTAGRRRCSRRSSGTASTCAACCMARRCRTTTAAPCASTRSSAPSWPRLQPARAAPAPTPPRPASAGGRARAAAAAAPAAHRPHCAAGSATPHCTPCPRSRLARSSGRAHMVVFEQGRRVTSLASSLGSLSGEEVRCWAACCATREVCTREACCACL